MSESEDDLKPFEYELPQTPLNVINSWVVRLQAVAIVTALLAQIEVSLIGMLEDVGNSPPASDTAVRIFGYSGLILNLGATLSAVLLLLAVTSVPTAARRLYMTCRHGYPRKVFLHTKNNSVIEVEPKTDTTTPSASNLQFPRSLPPQVVPDTLADMQSLNRFLLRGDTEGNILYAFGVARGWGFLLRHCIFCFIGGCVCTFVHVCIALWSLDSFRPWLCSSSVWIVRLVSNVGKRGSQAICG
ncbi:unnamed protein product [Somion occarium]|uniref:Uncharacterized protein n=1 Tax=Somion occarium TaxID=3059160 RepID=A0ABP1DQH5_9APHY